MPSAMQRSLLVNSEAMPSSHHVQDDFVASGAAVHVDGITPNLIDNVN